MGRIVISLYDFTGEAVRPWALAGYECHIYDIQHPYGPHKQRVGSKGGSITTHRKDLHRTETFEGLLREYEGKPVVFGMGFPVCTDMAVSGAAHFKRKAEANPSFQTDAVGYAVDCADFFEALGVPYFIENPVSVLATQWRKPDYNFHPYQYGEYLDDHEAVHPRWPDYIADRDAYTKKTCLWTGGGFVMPVKIPTCKPTGYSTQHLKLGGKSQRTKDIRSATPRGFAKAIYETNREAAQ
tara:strand:+ start:804 stop:1523 length:720 start_codon:yes stop_codon:yes gene_type:complete